MFRKTIFPIICLLTSFNSLSSSSLSQSKLEELAESLQIHYQSVDNVNDEICSSTLGDVECFSGQINLQTGDTALPANTPIYFSHIAPLTLVSKNNNVSIEHINGDLHRLTLHDGLAENQSLIVHFAAPFWHASRTDIMPNYYFAPEGLTPVIIASTKRVKEPGSNLQISQHGPQWSSPNQIRRNADDVLPLATPQAKYKSAMSADLLDVTQARPIPNVARRQDHGANRIVSGIKVEEKNQLLLASALKHIYIFGLNEASDGSTVSVQIDEELFNEPDSYKIQIEEHKISIAANTPLAANYGLITLSQLYNANEKTLPLTTIHDYPRYAYRGVHLDLARHFLGKAAIETLLQQMFIYKLNNLHLHLSDDEGWRLQIPGLPELSEIGGFRCHDLQERACLLPQLGIGPHKDAVGNGYLTVSDYQNVLKLANAYGIEIIPSFDMPGHARAAIVAMNARYENLRLSNPSEAATYLLADPDDTTSYQSVQYYNDNAMNPCLAGTYRFIEKVMDEIIHMHQQVNIPLKKFHMGADETVGAWKNSPVCKQKGMPAKNLLASFISDIVQLGERKGLRVGGWSDGFEKAGNAILNKPVYTNIWDTLFFNGAEKVKHFEDANIDYVLSLPDVLYFDFPYENHPYEPGYYWGSKATSTKKVFSFMPEHLNQHQYFWPDRMGAAYSSPELINKNEYLQGIQAQLWTEVTINQDAMEYMLFPRLLAFAERAWFAPEWHNTQSSKATTNEFHVAKEQDWQFFNHALWQIQVPALVQQGINVRIPPPAATIDKGMLQMASTLPNTEVQFSLDGTTWLTYTSAIPVTDAVWIRTRVLNSQKTSRHELIH